MMGTKTLKAHLADGTAKAEGKLKVLQQLASTMVDFDPRFEILPGTEAKRPEIVERADAYGAVPRQTVPE
jgi:hypothetical protein